MKRTIVFILLAIILGGAGFRFWHIQHESLWSDEGYYVHETTYSVSEIIDHLEYDLNPPLYTFILKGWIAAFGNSERSVRTLSALFGIATLPLTYLLGKELFSKRAGIYATLILAISTFHIQYAQEARSYTVFAFLVVLSYLFYFRIKKEPSSANITGYCITTLAFLYTHVFGFFIIIAQAIGYFLTQTKQKYKQGLIISGIVFIGVLPYLFVLYRQVTESLGRNTWIETPTLEKIMYIFHVQGSTVPLFFVLFFLGVIGYIYAQKKEKNHVRDLFFWWIVPIIFPIILSYLGKPFLNPRYTLPATIALYLMAAKGITVFKKRIVQIGMLLIIVISMYGSVTWYYENPLKEEWRSASSYLDEIATEDDIIIFYPGFTDTFMYQYYTEVNHSTFRLTYMTRPLVDTDVERIEPFLGVYEKIILVEAHNVDSTMLIESIQDQYIEEDVTSFRGITVYTFSN